MIVYKSIFLKAIKRHIAGDFNLNNTLALQNTKMIKTYVSIDPRVRPLILFIKHWAKQRNINDAGKKKRWILSCILPIFFFFYF
jgi:DNA polymerase sigma